ncbi:hypothetical protein [Hyalangium gracile]|uniref:hypothetical protein n=1 Tax=Hyalangium gracile TaxID=394092 RepID=UPI001CCE82A9|nr:hypothetical protein [Hyalangium gracile]
MTRSRRVLWIGLGVLLFGCSTTARRTSTPDSEEAATRRPRGTWRMDLPGPGSSRFTGMATQAGDILAIGSFEGETTVDGEHLVSSGEQDVLAVRLSQDGKLRWARRWGGAGYDSGEAIEPGADGSVLVVGHLAGAVDFDGTSLPGRGDTDCFIAKLAGEDGHTLWVRRFGGAGSAACRSAAFDRAGDVLVTGRFDGQVDLGFGLRSSAGGNDLLLVKLSGQDGTPRWARTFGGAGDDIGRDVAVDASGTVFLTGHFSSAVEPSVGALDFGGAVRLTSAGDSDAFLAAFSGDGHCLWARAIGEANFDLVKSVVPAPDGTLFLTGLFQGNVTRQPGQILFAAGGFEGFVGRYSSRGEELWRRRYPTLTSGHAIALTPSVELAMAGHFSSTLELGAGRTLQSEGGNDATVVLFDSTGAVRWAHRMGGPGHDYGYAVAAVAEGVAVAGMFAGPAPAGGGEPSSHGFIAWLPLR